MVRHGIRLKRAKKNRTSSHKSKPAAKHGKSSKSKGMSGRRRHGLTRRAHHAKSKHGRQGGHGRKGTTNKGTRSGGGARAGRRMDHYHMRRRYLHAGLAGAAGGGAVMGLDDDFFEDDPFGGDEAMLDDMDMADIMGAGHGDFLSELSSDCDELDEGSDSEDNESLGDAEDEGEIADGPPPLKSDDHYHVFFYHSANSEDQDQIEHYMSMIENSPYDLKVMSNERDFKSDLSHTQNLMLALGLSQRTVLLCSQEFIESDLQQFESVAYSVMPEEERKNKLVLLIMPDVELPQTLEKLPRAYFTTDHDCYDRLTKLLSSPLSGESGVEPSAPPQEHAEHSRTGSPHVHSKDSTNHNTPASDQPPKELTNYPNGALIRRVTACKYKVFEAESDGYNTWDSLCPESMMLCPKQEPEYNTPLSLTRRGLQITNTEFESILTSLTEASHITFFQKSVECSLPCLFLSTMVVTAVICFSLWFLVTGAVIHHTAEEEGYTDSIFWSFMILVFFIPSTVALIMLGILIHLVNYKYLKYRLKIEELNKRFRETNLVLHCQRAYWPCSARLQLYFIYYNFEQCQQTLYCHVHDDMTNIDHARDKTHLMGNGDSTTLKLDKIMKRVNTLTKKFEWDYFEALTKNRLPYVEEKEHRKKGMCFCQYVLHREMEDPPVSVVEAVKDRVTSMKKNAFSRSHRRKTDGSQVYLSPYSNNQGVAHFV